jgi:cation diffusion facilitator CzcD-associated flavoprotein CzcO
VVRSPRIPELPGADSFTGEQLHSSDYRNPRPCQGKKVLVMGSLSKRMAKRIAREWSAA